MSPRRGSIDVLGYVSAACFGRIVPRGDFRVSFLDEGSDAVLDAMRMGFRWSRQLSAMPEVEGDEAFWSIRWIPKRCRRSPRLDRWVLRTTFRAEAWSSASQFL